MNEATTLPTPSIIDVPWRIDWQPTRLADPAPIPASARVTDYPQAPASDASLYEVW